MLCILYSLIGWDWRNDTKPTKHPSLSAWETFTRAQTYLWEQRTSSETILLTNNIFKPYSYQTLFGSEVKQLVWLELSTIMFCTHVVNNVTVCHLKTSLYSGNTLGLFISLFACIFLHFFWPGSSLFVSWYTVPSFRVKLKSQGVCHFISSFRKRSGHWVSQNNDSFMYINWAGFTLWMWKTPTVLHHAAWLVIV